MLPNGSHPNFNDLPYYAMMRNDEENNLVNQLKLQIDKDE
tara:strand:+ start:1506 stop:1625 length:120 start_codon:yes stop_codon:yes gene_type:complete